MCHSRSICGATTASLFDAPRGRGLAGRGGRHIDRGALRPILKHSTLRARKSTDPPRTVAKFREPKSANT